MSSRRVVPIEPMIVFDLQHVWLLSKPVVRAVVGFREPAVRGRQAFCLCWNDITALEDNLYLLAHYVDSACDEYRPLPPERSFWKGPLRISRGLPMMTRLDVTTRATENVELSFISSTAQGLLTLIPEARKLTRSIRDPNPEFMSYANGRVWVNTSWADASPDHQLFRRILTEPELHRPARLAYKGRFYRLKDAFDLAKNWIDHRTDA